MSKVKTARKLVEKLYRTAEEGFDIADDWAMGPANPLNVLKEKEFVGIYDELEKVMGGKLSRKNWYRGSLELPTELTPKTFIKEAQKIKNEVLRDYTTKEAYKRHLNTLLGNNPEDLSDSAVYMRQMKEKLLNESFDEGYNSYKESIRKAMQKVKKPGMFISTPYQPARYHNLEDAMLELSGKNISRNTKGHWSQRKKFGKKEDVRLNINKNAYELGQDGMTGWGDTARHEYTHAAQLGDNLISSGEYAARHKTQAWKNFLDYSKIINPEIKKSPIKVWDKTPSYKKRNLTYDEYQEMGFVRGGGVNPSSGASSMIEFRELLRKNMHSDIKQKFYKSYKRGGTNLKDVSNWDDEVQDAFERVDYYSDWSETTARVSQLRKFVKDKWSWNLIKTSEAYKQLEHIYPEKFIKNLMENYWSIIPGITLSERVIGEMEN